MKLAVILTTTLVWFVLIFSQLVLLYLIGDSIQTNGFNDPYLPTYVGYFLKNIVIIFVSSLVFAIVGNVK